MYLLFYYNNSPSPAIQYKTLYTKQYMYKRRPPVVQLWIYGGIWGSNPPCGLKITVFAIEPIIY